MHMFKFSKMALDGCFQQFLHFVKKQRKSPVQKLLKCPIAETASSSYTEYRDPAGTRRRTEPCRDVRFSANGICQRLTDARKGMVL